MQDTSCSYIHVMNHVSEPVKFYINLDWLIYQVYFFIKLQDN